MPKKHFAHAKKTGGNKSSPVAPETENDYLTAGVLLEEAGEKWRAGDLTKSGRFFLRALETYHTGLGEFPQSFDLAYNSARLQYEVAQHPQAQHSDSLVNRLNVALRAHQYTLRLDQNSADLLFNTAQVLTSLAEASNGGKSASVDDQTEALRLLREALQHFQRCLEVQELQLLRAEDDLAAATEAANSNDVELTDSDVMNESRSVKDVQWASIVEPVTKETLLDTVIAQLETLTSICSIIGPEGHTGLEWVGEYYSTALQGKLPMYANRTGKENEAALVKARFRCAFSDARFHHGSITVSAYEQELASAFAQVPDLLQNPQALCDKADAELALNGSISAQLPHLPQSHPSSFPIIHWTHVTDALNDLTAAATLVEAPLLPRIHLRRGDCELLRHRIGQPSISYEYASRHASILLRNAATCYRGAVGLARRNGATDEEREARVKEAVVAWLLAGRIEGIEQIREVEESKEVVEEMGEEGILEENTAAELLKSLGQKDSVYG